MVRVLKTATSRRPPGFVSEGTVQRAQVDPGSWQNAAHEGPVLGMLVALAWLTVVSVMHPGMLTLTHSTVLAGSISSAAILIAGMAIYVAVAEFLLYGSVSSLCIALAFTVFAGADLGLKLIPLIGSLEHDIVWSRYGAGVDHTCAAALFLIAGGTVDRFIDPKIRRRVLAFGLAFTLVVVVLVTASVYHAGTSSVPDVAVRNASTVAALLFFAAGLLFWKASRTWRRSWFFWLCLGLALAAFSEVQYAVRQQPINVVQTGDLFSLVFFTSVLLALAGEWTRSYWWLRWQAQELGALHALTAAPAIHNVPSVVHHIESVVAEALGCTTRVVMSSRPSPLHGEFSENGQLGAPIPGGERISQFRRESVDIAEGRTSVGMPLVSSRERLGALVAVRPHGDEFSVRDIRLLQAFGPQAAMVLEQSLLYDEMAAGAILQERSRLAREIHDGLAQHLAFLKMRVAWLQRLPETVTREQLVDVEAVLETALIEARHAITTLRSEPEGTSTADAISRYASEFGQVSGIRVDVAVEPDVQEVPSTTRVELLRVVQEALNNVRKHARASNVAILLRPVGQGLELTVKDDGTGFSGPPGEQGHFGLEIMRERAESVHGRLDISSGPGGGTTVCLWVPGSDRDVDSTRLEPLHLGES